MKNTWYLAVICGIVIAALFTGCQTEDPGPLQYTERDYSLTDFDRLEMGSAFHIEVKQGTFFKIHVSGDQRNINDLEVYKSGSTLVIKYDEQVNRRHDTHIEIEMPVLHGVNFSGASVSTIEDFESDSELDLILSGASVCQIEAGYRELNVNVSGASKLIMDGLGDELHADVSGASTISAFDFPVDEAYLNVTGASLAKVTVSNELDVTASGASEVIYKGNPTLQSNTSGDSKVHAY